jgi:hypothetical protein
MGAAAYAAKPSARRRAPAAPRLIREGGITEAVNQSRTFKASVIRVTGHA